MNKNEVKNIVAATVTAVVGSRIATHRAQGGLMTSVLGLGAAALARRSLPGAVVVGGALIAKELFDLKKARDAEAAKADPAAATPAKPARIVAPKAAAKKTAPKRATTKSVG